MVGPWWRRKWVSWGGDLKFNFYLLGATSNIVNELNSLPEIMGDQQFVSKINSIQEYVDKQNTSCVSTKGKISENKMENLLNRET